MRKPESWLPCHLQIVRNLEPLGILALGTSPKTGTQVTGLLQMVGRQQIAFKVILSRHLGCALEKSLEENWWG